MTDWLKGKTYLDPEMTQDNGGDWVHIDDLVPLLADREEMLHILKDIAEDTPGAHWRRVIAQNCIDSVSVQTRRECDHDRAREELDIVCVHCGKMLFGDSADSIQKITVEDQRVLAQIARAAETAGEGHTFSESKYRTDRCVICQRPPGHPNHSVEQGRES